MSITKNFIFKGIITTTSNKQSKEFTTDNPRKSAYIKVDEENRDILLKQGLTEYTSEKDKEDFFILKLSENITLWEGKESQSMATDIDTNNFKTKEVGIACIKGKSKGNDYVRIYALNLQSMEDIELIEQENPFL